MSGLGADSCLYHLLKQLQKRAGPHLRESVITQESLSALQEFVPQARLCLWVFDEEGHPHFEASNIEGSTLAEELEDEDCFSTPFEMGLNRIGLLSAHPQAQKQISQAEQNLLLECAEYLSICFYQRHEIEFLSRNEEIFRQLAEHINEVFWMTDPKKNEMIYISPAYELIWGRSVAELYSRPISFIEGIHPDDQQKVIDALPLQPKGKYRIEYRVLRPDGSTKWVFDTAFPIKDSSGQVYRIAGIAQDITELKLAKRQIEEAQQSAIGNAKMAALGEMAGGVAHEINNPLTVILGKATRMKKWGPHIPQEDQEKWNKDISVIVKMVERIAKIIKGLRTFSRDAELDPFALVPVQSVIEETLELCSAKFRHKEINIKLELPEEKLSLECRPIQISQVLLNLLNNAFDAVLESEERNILISAKSLPNDWVEIRVTDSGKGIPDAIQSKILQPFFTTKDVGKGTGLGLSISNGIIESHKGKIFLDTEQELTSFVIQVPRTRADLVVQVREAKADSN